LSIPLPQPSVGAPAPAIELVDAEGHLWRLEDHRGKSVVVIFHRHIN